MRKNPKSNIVSNENSIAKSNELSMSKLNNGLTLQQMQLLSFAIYSSQKKTNTSFHKHEFEKYFDISKYPSKSASEDAKKLIDLKIAATEDLINDEFDYWNVFVRITYKSGLFNFEWSQYMIPHIIELKEKYVLLDLKITAKFKSSYSWKLYEYLKAHYGYWTKCLKREELLNLFSVEENKSYVKNTGLFKKRVLDVAINEINNYTELEVDYKEIKSGRSITHFEIFWSKGEVISAASANQLNEIHKYLNAIMEDTFKIIGMNDTEKRDKGLNILTSAKEIEQEIESEEVSASRADFLITNLKNMLAQINILFVEENRKAPQFYNWLEERD
ncbi:replication initiation protein [Lysinibacillus sp. CNPSo 3705]|uniref:replication initiation protein n=1 Tax=Lysinibacillus sp. CNPSo 3705 TaxID=3028148 RepID=UPI00236353A3|nr:replication initiation protein [Lysinibacillus sp. CNPSo 3705]MDD1505893.1 replication initiation protein [Lysinibacillus sp. CNPSo 3705]